MSALRLFNLETTGPLSVTAPGIGSCRVSCKECDSEQIYGIGATSGGSVRRYYCKEHMPKTKGFARVKNGPIVYVNRI